MFLEPRMPESLAKRPYIAEDKGLEWLHQQELQQPQRELQEEKLRRRRLEEELKPLKEGVRSAPGQAA